MNCRQYVLTILGIGWTIGIQAQSIPAQSLLPDSLTAFPSRYVGKVAAKASQLEEKLDKRSDKVMEKLEKLENKIQKKLARLDSAKAKELFANSTRQYGQLKQRLQENKMIQQYIPSLDSLATSLKFIQQNQALLSTGKQAKLKLEGALNRVKGMQTQFQKAEEIKKFLKERRQQLKDQLSQLGGNSYRYAKELKKLNKQAYYYSAQLSEYKAMLKDHKKAERKALELLSKTKQFKDFMRKNSQLASLFRLPGDPDDPTPQANLAGLQTRAQVNNLIQQQISAGGPAAQQQFQQNVQDAQGQLNQLKNKINQFGRGGSSEDIMPEGFKPNNEKTKSFLKRLEFGTNMQSQKANGYFPVTSDIGLSLGYKMNDKSVLGIGASYKLGLGQNIRNINITHQGVGLRSFVDWKIKGSFWMSGGYEMNYRNEFNRVDELKDLDAWQMSGLVGLSKVVSLKIKFFKKTKLQLLWDFLSYQQVPRAQPLLFRVGYNLN